MEWFKEAKNCMVFNFEERPTISRHGIRFPIVPYNTCIDDARVHNSALPLDFLPGGYHKDDRHYVKFHVSNELF